MVYDKVVGKIQNAKWILSLHVKKIKSHKILQPTKSTF
jgi:hypothetical protein